ncbi:helix-turn-helix transcriptional regulator [Mycoplana dimorpha]|uniref:Helix-turn-helix protein n=1 Tax=Mycoplana dimorpha TaxID=28320 RepID=A0A2T5BED0_MYCDI|nr:helix-turn-helix domain-containing protein [Mycoplana dimorpha]PTM97308.1 helix-turn-helix protein [Mycoplana dimorpha]
MSNDNMRNREKKHPHPHPIAIRPQDLADRLGVTRRYVYHLLRHPDTTRRLPAPFKIGRATFWRADEVQEWFDRQAERRLSAWMPS